MKATHRANLLIDTGWICLSDRRKDHKLIMMYKLLNNIVPTYLFELCPAKINSGMCYNLRTSDDLNLSYSRTERYKSSFIISSINLWNFLPSTSPSLVIFRGNLINWHGYPVCNSVYYIGERYPAVLHTTSIVLCFVKFNLLLSKLIVFQSIVTKFCPLFVINLM